MTKMSRAGRIEECKRVLRQQQKRKEDQWMTTGQVARRMGLKSSTYLKNLLFDMAMTIDNVMWRDDRGKREYGWVQHTQIPLPDRYIVINGKQHKIAGWVLDPREVENA